MRQASITAAWLLPNATTPEVRRSPHEAEAFHRLVRQLLTRGAAQACYEAGPCGYAPQRHLVSWGFVGAHLNLDKSEPPAEYRVVDRSGFE
jgi:hypothetical protein